MSSPWAKKPDVGAAPALAAAASPAAHASPKKSRTFADAAHKAASSTTDSAPAKSITQPAMTTTTFEFNSMCRTDGNTSSCHLRCCSSAQSPPSTFVVPKCRHVPKFARREVGTEPTRLNILVDPADSSRALAVYSHNPATKINTLYISEMLQQLDLDQHRINLLRFARLLAEIFPSADMHEWLAAQFNACAPRIFARGTVRDLEFSDMLTVDALRTYCERIHPPPAGAAVDASPRDQDEQDGEDDAKEDEAEEISGTPARCFSQWCQQLKQQQQDPKALSKEAFSAALKFFDEADSSPPSPLRLLSLALHFLQLSCALPACCSMSITIGDSGDEAEVSCLPPDPSIDALARLAAAATKLKPAFIGAVENLKRCSPDKTHYVVETLLAHAGRTCFSFAKTLGYHHATTTDLPVLRRAMSLASRCLPTAAGAMNPENGTQPIEVLVPNVDEKLRPQPLAPFFLMPMSRSGFAASGNHGTLVFGTRFNSISHYDLSDESWVADLNSHRLRNSAVYFVPDSSTRERIQAFLQDARAALCVTPSPSFVDSQLFSLSVVRDRRKKAVFVNCLPSDAQNNFDEKTRSCATAFAEKFYSTFDTECRLVSMSRKARQNASNPSINLTFGESSTAGQCNIDGVAAAEVLFIAGHTDDLAPFLDKIQNPVSRRHLLFLVACNSAEGWEHLVGSNECVVASLAPVGATTSLGIAVRFFTMLRPWWSIPHTLAHCKFDERTATADTTVVDFVKSLACFGVCGRVPVNSHVAHASELLRPNQRQPPWASQLRRCTTIVPRHLLAAPRSVAIGVSDPADEMTLDKHHLVWGEIIHVGMFLAASPWFYLTTPREHQSRSPPSPAFLPPPCKSVQEDLQNPPEETTPLRHRYGLWKWEDNKLVPPKPDWRQVAYEWFESLCIDRGSSRQSLLRPCSTVCWKLLDKLRWGHFKNLSEKFDDCRYPQSTGDYFIHQGIASINNVNEWRQRLFPSLVPFDQLMELRNPVVPAAATAAAATSAPVSKARQGAAAAAAATATAAEPAERHLTVFVIVRERKVGQADCRFVDEGFGVALRTVLRGGVRGNRFTAARISCDKANKSNPQCVPKKRCTECLIVLDELRTYGLEQHVDSVTIPQLSSAPTKVTLADQIKRYCDVLWDQRLVVSAVIGVQSGVLDLLQTINPALAIYRYGWSHGFSHLSGTVKRDLDSYANEVVKEVQDLRKYGPFDENLCSGGKRNCVYQALADIEAKKREGLTAGEVLWSQSPGRWVRARVNWFCYELAKLHRVLDASREVCNGALWIDLEGGIIDGNVE